MTTRKISNDQLHIEIDAFGAELQSIRKDGLEYLWQGNPEFWGRKSPVLFPIVGKLKHGRYVYDDAIFKMSGHGFARDKAFNLIDENDESVVYELRSDKETKIVYPFEFRLRITYRLNGNQLSVNWEVKNLDEIEMFFGIGAHPAFNVPLGTGKFEDYSLGISPEKNRQLIPLNVEQGTIELNKKQVVEGHTFNLSRELFKGDALVFETPEATEVVLSNSVNERSVKVSWEHMPFVGLWSPYPSEAPFVCIEPWCGIADDDNTDGDLTTKFGINMLSPGKKFKAGYTITIN
ncbi:aldose 1-epimerase family protein [Pseudolactococcus paracarnosus]|uniref:Aldose 1-epimerase family protein n=1 Tax=Pseudolactococcus paracarnosus TaxID=2749962 RepID=A0A7L4WE59_9LACT|nr:aldose 1-epimerase family protein [Lactococcus paracarnosus]SPC38204.1 LacX protein, plasmid [Lactococcus piscium]MCJ1977640.1 aldose 1-epimerase family protein [Lactococcus paracarnosus]MCJ1983783.1 aldose 1-epimerase family protein [Lactococcus paracarnosus]MCJ1993842.1 aldose 1-epimerase family protein [Lactococcus paracarnosus]MCJ1997305.1 aldose 1-epimerase family protein [Lactococcus paracarnosus]